MCSKLSWADFVYLSTITIPRLLALDPKNISSFYILGFGAPILIHERLDQVCKKNEWHCPLFYEGAYFSRHAIWCWVLVGPAFYFRYAWLFPDEGFRTDKILSVSFKLVYEQASNNCAIEEQQSKPGTVSYAPVWTI